ncbi:MAG: glycosyltransferase family 4 protein [Promethearchaeota archaeon]
MAHFRVGELDGVSLEMDKWKIILENAGHDVYYVAGTLGSSDGYKIPELGLDYEPSLKIFKNAFIELSDYETAYDFKKEIQLIVEKTKLKLQKFIDRHKIEFIIPNNIFSLPLNISATIALYQVIDSNRLHGVSHNHDFYWESRKYNPTIPLIQQYLDHLFPPVDLPLLKHVVINRLAQKQLKERKNIESTVVPNVFYFSEPPWKIDNFNRDLREKIGVGENDILVLQATRVVKRKGIELAIDLIHELNKPKNLSKLREKPLYNGRQFNNKIIFILPNLIEDTDYAEKLETKLRKFKIKYSFCNEYFASERTSTPRKRYSLWDSYVHADLVTYPSLHEGWGNQFLEAVKAKLPIILYEYDVYKSDIGCEGFKTISFGSNIVDKDKDGLVSVSSEIMERAAEETIRVLTEPIFREKMVEQNFQVGLEKFSLRALAKYIQPLIPSSLS